MGKTNDAIITQYSSLQHNELELPTDTNSDVQQKAPSSAGSIIKRASTIFFEKNEENTEETKYQNNQESINSSTILSQEMEPLSWPKLIFLFFGLALIIFVSSLDQTIIATAIPHIVSEFNSLGDVSWIGSAYLLTTAAVTPLYGKLTEVFGLRNIFIFAIVMFIGAVTTPERSAMLQGWFGAVFAISAAIGPLLGGVFSDYVTWRWASCNSLCGISSTDPTGSARQKLARIDYAGAVLLIFTVTTLLLGIGWGGNRYAWDSPIIISLLCAAIIMCIMFIWVEGWYAKEPFTPGQVLNQRITQKSAVNAGLMIIPLMVVSFTCLTITTILIGRLGAWTLPTFFSAGFACTAIAFGLSLTFQSTGNTGVETVILCVAGLGMGALWQSAYLSAQVSAEPKDIAVATMLCSFFEMIGATIGLAISGSVFNNALATFTGEHMVHFSSISKDAGLFAPLTDIYGLSNVVSMASAESMESAISLDSIDLLPEQDRQLVVQGIVKAFTSALGCLVAALLRPRRWSVQKRDSTIATTASD
ncbi:major facilitator superfamily domain-containing protein [Syncephalis fuscata]|nr:major facilitator superfamily domain-containing protein [Syncephalis fuscata]